MKKKFFLLTIIFTIMFILTGCSTNQETPEKVATKAVEYLSSGELEKVAELFYHPSEEFFDKDVLIELLEEKEFNLKGNKTNKVVDVSSEKKDEYNNPLVNVKVLIDNNKYINFTLVKENEKWYINAKEFRDKDIRIIVSKDVTVKINGQILNSNDMIKIPFTYKVAHPNLSSDKTITLEDMPVDAYVLKNPLIGIYKITIESKSGIIEDEIFTYSKYGSYESEYYNSYSSYTEGTTYIFQINDHTKELEKYVDEYLNNIYSNVVENHSMDKVNKYFDQESSSYETIKAYYEKAISNFGNKDNANKPNVYMSDFVISDTVIHQMNYYNDDNIIITLSYKVSYKYNVEYSVESLNSVRDFSKDVDTILIMRKDENNNFLITNGYTLFLY